MANLLRQETSDSKGRVMHVICAAVAGTQLLEEVPVLRARCSAGACPCGCDDAQDEVCRWHAVLINSALAEARTWHSKLCQRALALPEADRASILRVSLYLAILLQAITLPSLWEWLLKELRPATVAQGHPFVISSARFAADFARVIPPPEMVLAGGEPKGSHRPSWEEELMAALRHLQSNQFRIGKDGMGIFPSAWLLEHSCAPNAVLMVADSGLLSVTTRVRLRVGDPVTVCYHDHMEQWLAQPAPVRRVMVEQKLGFICCCDACLPGCNEVPQVGSVPSAVQDLASGGSRADPDA